MDSPSYLVFIFVAKKFGQGEGTHQVEQWYQILNSPRWLAIIVLIVIMVYNRPYNTHFARQSLSIALVLSYYVPNCFHFNPSQKIMKNCQARNWWTVIFIRVTIVEQSLSRRTLESRPSKWLWQIKQSQVGDQRCNQRYPASYTQLARNNSNIWEYNFTGHFRLAITPLFLSTQIFFFKNAKILRYHHWHTLNSCFMKIQSGLKVQKQFKSWIVIKVQTQINIS